jgi:hypothetical protein
MWFIFAFTALEMVRPMGGWEFGFWKGHTS